MQTIIAPNNEAVANAFAVFFAKWLGRQPGGRVGVALSGGSTPQALFRCWAERYREKIDWQKIHFFWGDERCVSPDDAQSNFGMTRELLLDHIQMPMGNVHRIRGEAAPEDEAERYEREIRAHLPLENGLPVFDLIILGMGADGHTASIFPDQMSLLTNPEVCAVAVHPESGQRRVSLTGPVINAARSVVFLVTGENKAEVVRDVLRREGQWAGYPAAYIQPADGELFWFLDEGAAREL